MLSLLHGKGVEPYLLMRRIPLEQVPEDEKEAAAWLQNLFVEKDKIIDSFLETGSFFKTSGVKEVPAYVNKPRLCSLVNFACWATFSLFCIFYYLITSLLAANWTAFITALSVLGLCKLIFKELKGYHIDINIMSSFTYLDLHTQMENRPFKINSI